jgi:hypothetical protein
VKRFDRAAAKAFVDAVYGLCLGMHQYDPVKAKAEFDRVMDMTWLQVGEWRNERTRDLELTRVRLTTLERLNAMQPGDVLHLTVGQLQPVVTGLDTAARHLPPWEPVEVRAEVTGLHAEIRGYRLHPEGAGEEDAAK